MENHNNKSLDELLSDIDEPNYRSNQKTQSELEKALEKSEKYVAVKTMNGFSGQLLEVHNGKAHIENWNKSKTVKCKVVEITNIE